MRATFSANMLMFGKNATFLAGRVGPIEELSGPEIENWIFATAKMAKGSVSCTCEVEQDLGLSNNKKTIDLYEVYTAYIQRSYTAHINGVYRPYVHALI